jgi:acetamidase/formamidase
MGENMGPDDLKSMSWSTFPGAEGSGFQGWVHASPGATLFLPVFEPGALLMLGDGHAAQIEIAQIVDPDYAAACQLDKQYLPDAGQ